MRNIILAVTAIFWLSGQTVGQKNNDEILRLRPYLPVSATTPITTAKSSALVAVRPLKIYMNTAGDPSAWDEVIKLIQDKKVTNRFGPIELVADASDANLFLIHYELTEKRRQEVAHTLTMDPGTSSRIYNGGKSDSRISTVVCGYILFRTSEGLEILRSYRDKVMVGEPRKELREAFFRLLNEQAKPQKHHVDSSPLFPG